MNVTPDTYPAAVEESTNASGVSWGAIFAGAAGAAALSLILVLLGSGLGFSAMSPWANEGASAKTIGISTVVWLALTQIIASGLGGYLAGRLRVKWSNMHGDEVYFRDTAHGFLAWAVATLVAAVLIVSSVSGIVGSGVKAGASAVAGVAGTAAVAAGNAASNTSSDQYGYFVDTLFRDDRPAAVSDDAARGVVVRIFTKTLANDGQLAPEDLNMVSLNYLLFHLPTSNSWAGLAGNIDLTTFWSMVLGTIGLKAWTGRSTAICVTVAVLPYVIIYVLWVAKIVFLG